MPPSTNLKKCMPLLQTFTKIRDVRKRKAFLQAFETNLLRAIREICYNLLHGNISLTEEEKKKIAKYKQVLRLLADSKTRKLKFRKVVTQTGRGFLPAVIPLIVAAISNMI